MAALAQNGTVFEPIRPVPSMTTIFTALPCYGLPSIAENWRPLNANISEKNPACVHHANP